MSTEQPTEQEEQQAKFETIVLTGKRLRVITDILINALENGNVPMAVYSHFRLNEFIEQGGLLTQVLTALAQDSSYTHDTLLDTLLGGLGQLVTEFSAEFERRFYQ